MGDESFPARYIATVISSFRAALLLVLACAGALHAEELPPHFPPGGDAAAAPVARAADVAGGPAIAPGMAPGIDVLADDPLLAERPRSSSSSLVAEPPAESGLAELLGTLARTLLMLLAVLALAYLSLHKGLGKWVQRSQAGQRLRVVERVGLDARKNLYIVAVDGREMLIGTGEGGMVRLADLSAGAPAGGAEASPSSFARTLEEQGAPVRSLAPSQEGAA